MSYDLEITTHLGLGETHNVINPASVTVDGTRYIPEVVDLPPPTHYTVGQRVEFCRGKQQQGTVVAVTQNPTGQFLVIIEMDDCDLVDGRAQLHRTVWLDQENVISGFDPVKVLS